MNLESDEEEFKRVPPPCANALEIRAVARMDKKKKFLITVVLRGD